MKTTFKPGHVVAMIALLALGIGTVAWTGNGRQQSNKYYQDTIPSRRKEVRESDRRYRKDLDKELAELDRALQSIENVREIDMTKVREELQAAMEEMRASIGRQKIDADKMHRDLQESLQHLNSEKIQQEMQQALRQLKDVDVQKMKADMERALERVNSDEFRKHLDESMEKVDVEKMRQRLHESLREINSEKMQQELARAHKQLEKIDMKEMERNMERVQEEMEKNKDNMKLNLDKAKENIRKAKEELRAYQEMIEDMENDGLIDTRDDYKIQFKNNELFINGEKQSSRVTDKYSKYFKEDTVIEKNGGNMNINRNRNEGGKRRTVSI